MTPYAKRKLNFHFQLGKGSFGGSGFDTVTLENLRANVHVVSAMLPMPGSCIAYIYGTTLSRMNELTVAGLQYENRGNMMRVEAGDERSGMTTIFNGNIIQAFPYMNAAPDTPLVVVASPGHGIQIKPEKPVSFQGSVGTETAMRKILAPTGFELENDDVNAVLMSPHFPGTAMAQALSCIRAADCFGALDTREKRLSIWKKNAPRKSGELPLVSPETGAIGYPEYERNLVRVRTLFDPQFVNTGPGKQFEIKSQLTPACGVWAVNQVDLDLTSETINGAWEMNILAMLPGP